MTVADAVGTPVGTVTSGTFSPTLQTGIALALLAPLAANAQAERSEEVRIASDPEVMLAGTLRMPARPAGARVPAVLLLGGGGPSPRGISPTAMLRR